MLCRRQLIQPLDIVVIQWKRVLMARFFLLDAPTS